MLLYWDDPRCLDRPWIWLLEVMKRSDANGDHLLTCTALAWALNFHVDLFPRMSLHDQNELHITKIPADLRSEIARLGVAAARAADPDLPIVVEVGGSLTAGKLINLGSLLAN